MNKALENLNELSESEALVLYVLSEEKFATVNRLAKILGWSEAKIRKILSSLRKLRLTDYRTASSLLPLSYGIFPYIHPEIKIPKYIKDIDPRTRMYYSTVPLEEIEKLLPVEEYRRQIVKKYEEQKLKKYRE